ncbi:MAG: aspartate:alanine exchanger family transporter [Nitrososphaerales archaeon]
MSTLLGQQLLVLCAIMAIGTWLGRFSWRGLSLANSAVFFAGLAFGHFGFTIPKPIVDLGLVLFLYATGLQAGPRFFRSFRKQGAQVVVVAAAVVAAAAVVTAGLAKAMHLSYGLAAGMFSGAVSSTTSLAGAAEAVSRIDPAQAALVSVGYGIAFPLALICVPIAIQFVPRLVRRDIPSAEARWLEAQAAEQPPLAKQQFEVTNPNVDGRRICDLNAHRLSQVNISRVRLAGEGGRVVTGAPEVVLRCGDVVLAVGAPAELEKLRLLIGRPVETPMEANVHSASRDVYVTESKLAGKRLMDLHIPDRYNVIITRIRRQGLEIAPVGSSTLELGDTLRVVGEEAALAEFARLVSGDPRHMEETDMLSFLIGLVLGVALGAIPITLAPGLTVTLGAAAGAFLVSLVLGHFGRIGPFRLYVPSAAKNILKELGAMLFLAGLGTSAGGQLAPVFREQGPALFAAGLAITAAAFVTALFLAHFYYKMDLLSTLGLLCGVMSSSSSLAAVNSETRTDVPAITYATAMPVVLIFKILAAQLLVQVLRLVL